MTIEVPFRVPGYQVGAKVDVYEFLAAVDMYVKFLKADRENAEKERNAALETIDELNYQLDEKEEEIETMRQNERDYYKPLNPFVANGVSPSDF